MGEIIDLEYKVGDTIFQIVKCDDNISRIFEMKIDNICKYGSIRFSKGEPILWNLYLENDNSKSYATFYDINRTIFLTYEKAQLKLQEI